MNEIPEKTKRFNEWAARQGLRVVREYVEAWVDEETGEEFGGFWSNVLMKEAVAPDGKLHAFCLDVSDSDIERSYYFRQLHGDLLAVGWKFYLRDQGLTPEEMKPV